MKTEKDVKAIVSNIKYNDWKFFVGGSIAGDGYSDMFLQVVFDADGNKWHGRKWRLSSYMTKSEIVQTALMAVLAAAEHEAREHFLYNGRAVFGPHIDVDKLYDVCKDLNVRAEVAK